MQNQPHQGPSSYHNNNNNVAGSSHSHSMNGAHSSMVQNAGGSLPMRRRYRDNNNGAGSRSSWSDHPVSMSSSSASGSSSSGGSGSSGGAGLFPHPPQSHHQASSHQQQAPQPLMEIGQVPINLPVGPDHHMYAAAAAAAAYSSNPHILICSDHPTTPHIPPCQVHGIYQQPFAQPCGLGAHFTTAAGFAAAAAAAQNAQTIPVPTAHQAHYPQLSHISQHVSRRPCYSSSKKIFVMRLFSPLKTIQQK